MQRVNLNGTWRLSWISDPGHARPDELPADLQSVEARVPGNVELDLMRAGTLPDLSVGKNVYRAQELEAYDWWYRRDFTASESFRGRRAELVFHGLDCFAEVWLNGVSLGSTANMLVEHRLEAGAALRPGATNRLDVHIRSAAREARRFDYPGSVSALETNHESLYVRKAPHMWGWDIAPRIVSAGIWRSVELVGHDEAEIDDLYYHTIEIDGERALLGLHWKLRIENGSTRGMTLRLSGRPSSGGPELRHEEPVRFVCGHARFAVPEARLWWPRGYGESATYNVRCELLRDGRVLDAREDRIGIRIVELERTDTTGSEGGQFLFRVNGEPVMCRGSNWVPLDALHSRDAERYQAALELFDDLGCTILRCWGGNVYEDHPFFDFCDTHGIMVWQDFAFACAIYPQEERFLDAVREEAVKVVRKLRNHPSLILWSGDNEIDEFYLHLGRDPSANRISRELLPRVCADEDPHRPYLPSSPYASPEAVRAYLRAMRPGGASGELARAREREEARRLMPEQHLWGPRDYYKSPFYAQSTAHFASEIGYHGCPNVSSLKRFLSPPALWPWQDNAEWRAHAADQVPEGGRYAYRIKLMADQVRELFGSVPEDLESFVLASQLSQAEAKKYFIESFRIRKWRRTGIIWWNVLDCWPQFSDAVVDYYFGKKLAYWYIRRSQLPFMIAMDEPESWHCALVACNDTLREVSGSFRVADAESGATIARGEMRVGGNASVELAKIRVSRAEHRLFIISWDGSEGAGGNHYLLGAPPLDLGWYRGLLGRIASIPPAFDPESIGV